MDLAPPQVYATLLDEGEYLCSLRTMYRILSDAGEVMERRDQIWHPRYEAPELVARRPNQVWSWDITKLQGPEKWTYYYLYVILDLFSRYVVGWLLAQQEKKELARQLIADTCRKEHIGPAQLTLHADRGATMRSKPVALLLVDLGVTKTHSRPHVPNDNPYSESQFKTLKTRPEFPERFVSLEYGRDHCRDFFRWYNLDHHHSGLALFTPHDVHHGGWVEKLARRAETLRRAYEAHPERFPLGLPEPKAPPSEVWINKPDGVISLT
jgi:putative transposase